MSDSSDKREFDRKQLVYYLTVLYHESDRIAGYLADISENGMMLFSPESMAPESTGTFRIGPDPELGLSAPLVLDARCMWCEKDVNPDYYIIGFRFLDLDQSRQEAVGRLVKKYGFDH